MFRSPRWLAASLLISCAVLGAHRLASGYSLLGWRWPDGSHIVMRLQLNRAFHGLQDGFPSWNASAADALQVWNQHLGTVQFVEGSGSSTGRFDGQNSVFFANDIYGEGFGTYVLAVTMNYSPAGGVFTETDVIFNNRLKWDSYRGAQQGSGASATYDLHRVALHEFGHVLGLDHPDENGQYVHALMNSISGDLDTITSDDIAGAKSLYGLNITSPLHTQIAYSGQPFSYQIRADNSPYSYGATGLPPGIQLNTSSGLISGRCPGSGTFQVDITAEGTAGVARGRFQLVIYAHPLTSSYSPPAVLVGDGFTYRITANNNPVSYTATGLPDGLSLDANTGVISGVPSVTGTFSVQVKAIASDSEAAGTITIRILPPQITSPTETQYLDIGIAYSYQLRATHNPSSFGATSLPQGLQIDTASGLISGTPTQTGSYYATVSAQTSHGLASTILILVVQAPHFTTARDMTIDIGSPLSLQLTTSHPGWAFTASGLPPGLQLNASSGLIHGVPELSGYYQVNTRATTAWGEATGWINLVVRTQPIADLPVATFRFHPTMLIADPLRPRFYAAVDRELRVIDTNTFAQIAAIPLPAPPTDLALSLDGTILWLPRNFGDAVDRLDLETLTLREPFRPQTLIFQMREGTGNRLFTTGSNRVAQVDGITGAVQAVLWPNTTPAAMEMSADGRTLFLARNSPGVIARFDVSQATPVLSQEIATSDFTSSLRLSHDGRTLLRSAGGGQSVLLDAQNMSNNPRSLPPNENFWGALFTRDDAIIAFGQSGTGVGFLRVSDKRYLRPVRTPGASGWSPRLVLDRSDQYVAATTVNGLQVYETGLFNPPPRPRSLLNVSTRMRAQQGDNVLIGGFILAGTQPKKVVLRAIGPSLPLNGRLADPLLRLHGPDGALLAQNDNWNAYRTDILKAGLAPNNERDAGLVVTLSPGAYTAIVQGVGATAGLALVELYDADNDSSARIANISTRGRVETGDNVMIGGFIVSPDQPTKVIVRATGPSLLAYGVVGPLMDTTLSLHDPNGALLAENDDWRSHQEGEIMNSNLAPTDAREAAIVATLPPGGYTAIVSGKNGTSGVALVEVYNLEP